MGAQVGGAQGQQHGEAAGPGDDRREHRGRARERQHFGAGRRAVQGEIADPERARLQIFDGKPGLKSPQRQRAQGLGVEIGRAKRAQSPSISLALHIGKKSPRDRTPNHGSSRQRSVAPSATRS